MWPFTSKSGSTVNAPLIAASIVVTLIKETTFDAEYVGDDGNPVIISYLADARGYKVSYKEKESYTIYTENIDNKGFKWGKNHIVINVNEAEANKVYDFIIKQKGHKTLTETVKQQTIKQ